MGKQSSRIYGIKIKEHRNYYDYPKSSDPSTDISEIRIYYDKNATNKWIIQSNYNNIWYNGTAYPSGSVILAFKDGTDCTNKPFMLMAPHEEDGVIVNYFYRITGRFSTVPSIENSESFIDQEDTPLEPTVDDSDSIRYTVESGHPGAHYDQLYVRKFVNDEEVGHTIVTAESIRAHKVAHSSNYYNYLKVFNALLFDWNGMLPRMEDSYTFSLYSNVTYLEITPTTYQKGWKIKSWSWDEPVNLNILDFSRQPEPLPKDEHDIVKFNIATNKDKADSINIDKVVNNAVVASKTYSSSDILAYKNEHPGELIIVFENLLLDFNEDQYPGYKYYIKANNNYLKYNDNWISFGDIVNSWRYNEEVNFEIDDYSNRYENEVKEETTYNVYVEHIKWDYEYEIYVNVHNPVSLTKDEVCYDIFYDHKEMYYNNYYHKAAWLVYDQPSEGYKKIGKLAIMWADPFWVLITTADGVKYNGVTYKGRKLLKMWHEDEAVDMTMTRVESRKVVAKGQDYDDIIYVITTAESNNAITLIKRINDLDDDTIVFDPETDCPLDFYNIRFTYSNGIIHVYSKCDFIYLSSTNYKTGRDIIDWPIEEKVNFGIKDETNAYEIKKTATYTVKSEPVTITDYDITTLMDEHWTPLKVAKVVNGRFSNEEIVNFYDCTTEPYYNYDDKLQLIYDPASTYWILKSLSDDIYKNNVNYPEGSVIETWPFGEDRHVYGIGHSDTSHYEIRLHSVEVDSKASYETTHEYITYPTYQILTQIVDHSLDMTCDQPGSSAVTVNVRYMDAMDWYRFFNLLIKYDPVASEWILKSDSNSLFIGQENFKKGSIISKWDYYSNVNKTVSTLVEDIKHTTRDDKEKDLLVSNKSFWLYGYIWQKEETPPPGPWPYGYNYDILLIPYYLNPSNRSTFLRIKRNQVTLNDVVYAVRQNVYLDPWRSIAVADAFEYYTSVNYDNYKGIAVYCYNNYVYDLSYGSNSFWPEYTRYGGRTFTFLMGLNKSLAITFISREQPAGEHKNVYSILIEKSIVEKEGDYHDYIYDTITVTEDWEYISLNGDYVNQSILWSSYYNSGYIENYNELNQNYALFGFPFQGVNSSGVDMSDYDTRYANSSFDIIRFAFSFYLFYELNYSNNEFDLIKVPNDIIDEIKTICLNVFGLSNEDRLYFGRIVGRNPTSNVRSGTNSNSYFVVNNTAYIYTEYYFSESCRGGVYTHYHDTGDPVYPDGWFNTPVRILFSYNKQDGVKYYDISNTTFGTKYRSLYTQTDGYNSRTGRYYTHYEKQCVTNYTYSITYKNEVYIYVIGLKEAKWEETFPGYYQWVYYSSLLIYKLMFNSNGEPNFILQKEYDPKSYISIRNLTTGSTNNFYYDLTEYGVPNIGDDIPFPNLVRLFNASIVNENVYDKNLLDGLYFYYKYYNSTPRVIYFDNPLLEESEWNFCFDANY